MHSQPFRPYSLARETRQCTPPPHRSTTTLSVQLCKGVGRESDLATADAGRNARLRNATVIMLGGDGIASRVDCAREQGQGGPGRFVANGIRRRAIAFV